MEENEAKDDDSEHHRKCSGVVRIGRYDEPFILGMLQWTNWHLMLQHNILF